MLHKRRDEMPGLFAVYAFGSRVDGTAGPGSDLGLAVLVKGYADSLELRRLAGMFAELARCPADQLGLRGATTVMQDRFVTTGQCGWAQDAMKRMVGFRNIAVHHDQTLRLLITVAMIETHRDEFPQYSLALLLRGAGISTHPPQTTPTPVDSRNDERGG